MSNRTTEELDRAKQDIKTWRKFSAMRKAIIDDFLEELKDKMDRMKDNDASLCPKEDIAPRSRGYNYGITQIQDFIQEIRP